MFSLHIQPLVRAGVIRDGVHTRGEMKFRFPEADAFIIAFEVSTRDRANRWIQVRGTITDTWSGTPRDFDHKIYLATVVAGHGLSETGPLALVVPARQQKRIGAA